MEFDAASRSADLKMIEVKEPNARHTDDNSQKSIELLGTCLSRELVEHAACDGEPVPRWRSGGATKVGIVQFNDDVRARIVWILENDVNVVIVLTLHTTNLPDDLIDAKLLFPDTVISSRTAMGGDVVERTHARFDRGVQPNTVGVSVTKAFHVGAVEGTTRRERTVHRHDRNSAATECGSRLALRVNRSCTSKHRSVRVTCCDEHTSRRRRRECN